MLTKACPTYGTTPGMFAVIAKYDRNEGKDRMEAVVAVFGDESVARSGIGGSPLRPSRRSHRLP